MLCYIYVSMSAFTRAQADTLGDCLSYQREKKKLFSGSLSSKEVGYHCKTLVLSLWEQLRSTLIWLLSKQVALKLSRCFKHSAAGLLLSTIVGAGRCTHGAHYSRLLVSCIFADFHYISKKKYTDKR